MADEMINMVGPDGWRGTVPSTSLETALQMGYRPEAVEETHERYLEQTYGDSPIKAGLEGAARGATFGLSDLLLQGLGTEKEALRERKERNAIAAGVGEAAGFIGSTVLSGGAGAGAVAGKLGAGAAERVAGSGIVKGLAESGSIAARAAARVAPTAIREGVVGAAFGLGSGVSEVSLSKDPMGAEAVISTLGSHVALGGVLGAGVGVAGEGLGALVKSAGGAARKAASEISDALGKPTTATSEAIARDPVIASGVYDKAGLEAMRKAEMTALGEQRSALGKQIADDVLKFREDYRDFGVRLVRQLPKGQGLGREVIQAERSLQNVIGDMKSLAEDPGRALGALRRQEQQLTQLSERLPAEGFEDVLKRNAELQERITSFSGAGKTSDRIAAIDARLEEMARPLPGAGITRKVVGTALGGLVGGALGGGWIGSMIGRELAEGATGALMKRLTGVFAERANAIADGVKSMLSKAAPPAPAMEALGRLASASTEAAGGSVFTRAATVVSHAAANLDQTRASIHEQLAGIRAVDPVLADQTETGLLKRTEFLSSKLPKAVDAMGSLADGYSRFEPSDTQKARFARYAAAAEDPVGRITAELRSRQVAKETVETLQELYPEMLRRLQEKITTQLADPTIAARLSYPVRLELSKVMGVPIDSTLRPNFISRMQETFAGRDERKPPSGSPSNSEPTQTQRLGGG